MHQHVNRMNSVYYVDIIMTVNINYLVCGVGKCDLCRFDLDSNGWCHGARCICTYAMHGWLEWI